MNTNDSTERLVRVETQIGHIEDKVDTISVRQQTYENNANTSFTYLRENAVRQQIATENLVKAIQEQHSTHADRQVELRTEVNTLKTRLEALQTRVIGITTAGGFVWVVFSDKVLSLLGLH